MKRYRFFLTYFLIMPMNKKRTLAEIKEILEAGDDFLGSVTIPILKEIIFVDLGMNASFVNHNVGDQRKLLDWFNATKKAFKICQDLTEMKNQAQEVLNNDNISRTES